MSNSNSNSIDSNSDSKVNGSANKMAGMEDTEELILMRVYAQRRKPQCTNTQVGSPKKCTETVDVQANSSIKKKKKKKNVQSTLQCLFGCFRPHREPADFPPTNSPGNFRCITTVEDEDQLNKVADRLTEIADSVNYSPGDLETDGEQDALERLVGLLLRETGDRFNEEVLKDASLFSELFGSYNFYERTISTFLWRLGLTSDPRDQESPKTQIALTCEATSRLSVVDSLPMNQMLGFGAKYLQDHFSTWARQQGGYTKALADDDDEVDDEVN